MADVGLPAFESGGPNDPAEGGDGWIGRDGGLHDAPQKQPQRSGVDPMMIGLAVALAALLLVVVID